MLENCKDHLAGVDPGSVVSAAWTQNRKAEGTQQKPSLEPMCPVVQGESWGVDCILPWTMETAVYTTRVVFVTGFKPRAYLHQLLQIRAHGPSQNLFIGHLSVGHVFSSSPGGGVSPPPVKYRNAVLAGPVSRGSTNTGASFLPASSSLLSHWVIAVWGMDWFCLGFGM